MEKMNFIKTKDIDTKNQLEKLGYTLLSFDNGVYTFLNDVDVLAFSDEKKCVYTNAINV